MSGTTKAKWIKVCTDIFEDEKIVLIELMPDADEILIIWFKLLCLAGKQNNQGIFEVNGIPYNIDMFAALLRRSKETIQKALDIFQKFGMVEITDDIVSITNWNKHQSLDALEKKREYQRELMRKRRAEQKQTEIDAESENGCDDNCDTNCDDNCDDNVSPLDKNRIDKNRKEEEKNNITPSKSEDFERLWSLYPRKEGKKDAFNAYKRALKKGITPEQIESGINAYVKHLTANNTAKKYIKQGSTYFNGECWNDVYEGDAKNESGNINVNNQQWDESDGTVI